VAIWYKAGSFTAAPNRSDPNMVAFNLPTMKTTAPTEPFVVTVTVPVLPAAGDSFYYFSASVFWNNPDSVCGFIRANGDSVRMLTVDSIPLLLRYNGASVETRRPEFKWNQVTGATQYKIEIADNAQFISPAVSLPVTDTFYLPLADLGYGAWYWRVSSSKNIGLFCLPDSLIVAPPTKIKISGTINNKVSLSIARSRIAINWPENESEIMLFVFDCSGRNVFTRPIARANSTSIDGFNSKEKHSPGLYLAVFQTKAGLLLSKNRLFLE
jgi:hypothetical protein